MKDKIPMKSNQNALTKTSIETSCGKTLSRGCRIGGSIRGVGSKRRDKTSTVREPETAEGAEDTGWETVAEDPFENTADYHE
ncbi:hypothetical protein HG530_011315 [Fusarium avenaceum]|nr:hypothetical protein HG530_011315 [Fusarium avenaceum]